MGGLEYIASSRTGVFSVNRPVGGLEGNTTRRRSVHRVDRPAGGLEVSKLSMTNIDPVHRPVGGLEDLHKLGIKARLFTALWAAWKCNLSMQVDRLVSGALRQDRALVIRVQQSTFQRTKDVALVILMTRHLVKWLSQSFNLPAYQCDGINKVFARSCSFIEREAILEQIQCILQ